MKLFEIRDGQGRLVAFQVSSLFLFRRGVAQIAKSIPGSRTTFSSGLFAWPQGVFCKFEVDGGSFLVDEPFEDNSRYWIGGEPPGWHPAFFKSRCDFRKSSRPWFLTSRRAPPNKPLKQTAAPHRDLRRPPSRLWWATTGSLVAS